METSVFSLNNISRSKYGINNNHDQTHARTLWLVERSKSQHYELELSTLIRYHLTQGIRRGYMCHMGTFLVTFVGAMVC